MDWLSLLLFTGAAQGGLLCLVILSLRGPLSLTNSLLAVFVGVSSFGLLMQFLGLNEVLFYGHLSPFYSVVTLKGPALYLYVCALCQPEFRLTKRTTVHLFPVPVALALTVATSVNTPGLEMGIAEQHAIKQVPWITLLPNVVFIAYGYASLKVLSTHRETVEGAFSSIEGISLGWLWWLVLVTICIRLPAIMLDLAWYQGLVDTLDRILVFAVLHLLVVYIISIGGMRQSLLFTQSTRELILDARRADDALAAVGEAGESGGKYLKSRLPQERMDEIWRRLEALMQNEQLYLQSGLTLADVARHLELSSNDLSQVINSSSGGNFYEYVNRYRVERAKALLLGPEGDNQKMVALALEVGFNSQSTFYNQFKRFTGMTPRKFCASREPATGTN